MQTAVAPAAAAAPSRTRHTCSYCGLSFTGPGFSADGTEQFCCCGCYFAQKITGSKGDEGIAASLILRLGIGAFFAMNTMMLSMVLYFTPAPALGRSAIATIEWMLLILSTPAMAVLAGPFVLGALRDLRNRRMSTDALVLTGSTAAYFVSGWHVISGRGHIYFDTATMLLLIVTLGRLFEASAKGRTSAALKELSRLNPDSATLLRDGKEIEIPADQVQRGDVMIIRPGGRIPADGVVLAGECLVEEAAFTGEARPRRCRPGDSVYGGSVNCDGLMRVEATSVGQDSLLAQIQKLVTEAREGRAPIERLTERVARVFVPVVWLLAVLAAAYWGLARHDVERAALSALAVLVVACPCALGIATPLATSIAIGRAARTGILVRSAEVLERLSRVKRVFLDKTGTLTDGDLAVTSVEPLSKNISPDDALAWAAVLESGSGHAIGRAIAEEARRRGLPQGAVSGLVVHPGRGVEGNVTLDGETRRVVVGTADLVGLNSDDHTASTVYVSWNGVARASIELADTVRPAAREAIGLLRSCGITTALISGDCEGAVTIAAEQAGIEKVHSRCAPDGKAAAVADSVASGEGVVMVGDGINDAPALARADVGIAFGSGTDLARESSDITLLGNDLRHVPWIIQLSKRTCSIIRQNLWWAFGYNSIALTLAFLGYVHPLIAASGMVVSSLAVVSNSLRLLKLK